MTPFTYLARKSAITVLLGMIAITSTPAQAMQQAAKLFGIIAVGGASGYTIKQHSAPKKPAFFGEEEEVILQTHEEETLTPAETVSLQIHEEEETLTPDEEVILQSNLRMVQIESDPKTQRPTAEGFLSQQFIEMGKFSSLKQCLSKDCNQSVEGLLACMNVPQSEAEHIKDNANGAVEAFKFTHVFGKSCMITLEKARTPENNDRVTQGIDMCRDLRTISKQGMAIFEKQIVVPSESPAITAPAVEANNE